MTIILIVLNLLLNVTETITTNDAGKQRYYDSNEYIIVDELVG